MIRKAVIVLLSLIVIMAMACGTSKSAKKKNALLNLWLPFTSQRVKQVYYHSLVESPRFSSDCEYSCPDVDIWQYQYKNKDTNKIITSDKPIAIQKQFWKSPNEARIIAISLFDSKEFYYKALLQYLESFKSIKRLNHIKDDIWGYETFTVRVYVSKRNPKDLAKLGEIKNRTSDEIINNLLDLGCEIAYVDDKLPEARKDGTFWRFAAASDDMPEGQRVRYLMRDADNILTAAEMYALADWINSDFRYHRMHLIPICFGPLTAMLWGGTNIGVGDFHDFHDLVKNYPYRFQYGDDELFTRDLMWPRLKSVGSVLTHNFKKSSFTTKLASPYKDSCEEPTQKYCLMLNKHAHCVDRILPESEKLGGVVEALGLRISLEELVEQRPEIFDLELEREDRQFIYQAFKSK